MEEMLHVSVLKEEVLHFLNPQPNENFVDCTAGAGGHSFAILKRNGPEGKVLAFEWDKELYGILREEESERFIPVNESYTLLEETVESRNFFPVAGILFDLGLSSFQLERSGRGFSFLGDEPLDMRYSEDNPLTAKEIVNRYGKKDLLYILRSWGEEKYAKRIVEKMIEERKKRKIKTTKELVEIIEKSVPLSYRRGRIHCATRTFQALRIAVNGEVMGFESTLEQALNVLMEKGRIAVITFHGIEEKILLRFAKRRKDLRLITRKPVVPSKEEIETNIRARSAKLRVLIKE